MVKVKRSHKARNYPVGSVGELAGFVLVAERELDHKMATWAALWTGGGFRAPITTVMEEARRDMHAACDKVALARVRLAMKHAEIRRDGEG